MHREVDGDDDNDGKADIATHWTRTRAWIAEATIQLPSTHAHISSSQHTMYTFTIGRNKHRHATLSYTYIVIISKGLFIARFPGYAGGRKWLENVYFNLAQNMLIRAQVFVQIIWEIMVRYNVRRESKKVLYSTRAEVLILYIYNLQTCIWTFLAEPTKCKNTKYFILLWITNLKHNANY